MNTIAQTPIHISERFFAKAARYFGDFKTAIAEIIQNAYRASLPILESGKRPRVEVSVSANTIEIRDFGVGIDDVGAALSIAASGWDPSVEIEQDPAGMGLCAALAFSATTTLRSRFGELTVEGSRFFADPEYRAGLLSRIQPNPLDSGTSIILTGPKVADPNDLFKAILTVESVCYSHCAIDVFVRSTLADGPTPWKQVRTMLHEWQPFRVDKKPVVYRGYPVLENATSGYWRDPGTDNVTIVWHGQLISVDLKHAALYRDVSLPIGGTVRTYPRLPAANRLAIVIDHGFAPVTPKLPDRTSLVMDEKTVEFIWGFVQPLMDAAIASRCARMAELKEKHPDLSTMQVSEFTSMSERGGVTSEVESALFRHFFNAVPFTLPSWAGSSHSSLYTVFADLSAPRTRITDGVILHTSDDRCIALPCGAESDDNAAQIVFGKSCGHTLSGVEEHGNAAAFPAGIALSHRSFHELTALAPTGILVVDVPFTFAECVVDRPYSNKLAVKQFLVDNGLLNARVYHFDPKPCPDAPDELEEQFDRLNEILTDGEREVTEELADTLSAADRVTDHVLSGVVICTEDYGSDPSTFVWVGNRQALIRTTHLVEDIVDHYEWDEDPEVRRQECTDAFAAIRHSLGAAAEISPELVKITEKCGGYIPPGDIFSMTLDARTHEIVIEYHSGGKLERRVTTFKLS